MRFFRNWLSFAKTWLELPVGTLWGGGVVI